MDLLPPILAYGLLGFFLFLAAAWWFPDLLRVAWAIFLRTVYRFRVYHQGQIPSTGPALLVCNHTCYIDWMLFWVASPRPVRYVVWEGYYKNPILRFFLSWVRHRTVRIDNRSARPHAVADALSAIAESLNAGEVVLIYPEGRLSRNGYMLPFSRGIERVLKLVNREVPVIPAATHGMWGSFFSHKDDKILRRISPTFRRKVSVWFGQPMLNKPTAAEIRAAVAECAADLANQESYELPTVFAGFIQEAVRWRSVFRVGFIDNATGTERKLTFGQVLVGSWCLKSWLATRVGTSRQVGIWLPTGLGSCLTNLAVGYLGRVTVNLNYTAGTEAVTSAVEQAEITHVITSRRFEARIPLPLPPEIQRIYLEDALAGIGKPGKLIRLLAILVLPAGIVTRLIGCPRRATDELQTLIFSSGSTGEPKGVMLTYRNIASNVDSFLSCVSIGHRDTMMATLPFFHSFGYTVCLWACLRCGARSIYHPDPRAAVEVGELCQKHSATIMMGTATFLRFYLRRCQPEHLRSLTLLICGAEKLPVKLAYEFQEKFGILPLEGYGCTETSPVVCVNLYDVEIRGVKQIANCMGTVGQPITGVVAKAFDTETFAPMPPGEEGMLGVKGPNVMLGYWKQPEKTKVVIRDGWYMTGDIGRIERDGFIRITGRISRFAKSGGEMIPLEKLEQEMQEILGTGERMLTACAVPDEKRGERVVVLFLPEVAEKIDGLLKELPNRGLPNLWIPSRKDCYEVATFPALGSGKLDLKAVGELAKQRANQPG